MGGYFKSKTLLFCALVLSMSALAQPIKRTVYTDHNHRIVGKERDAFFIVSLVESYDTVYFETFSKNPKGKIAQGKYARDMGNDLRNCYIENLWPNGKVRSRGVLLQSWNDGLWEYFDEDGNIYSEVNYVKGVKQGDAKRYYQSGLVRTYTYNNNVRNGETLIFDTSGRIHAVGNFENDSLHGLWLEYDDQGNFRRKANYNFGRLVSDTQYYENGAFFNCESFDSLGKIHGRAIMFNPSGKMARYDEYDHGNLLQSVCIHPLIDADYEGEDCPPRIKEAIYPGGIDEFHAFVQINQEYPEAALKWSQQGLVEFRIVVNKYGAVVDIIEENMIPLGYGIEKECMRLLDQMKKFNPKQINGKSISCEMVIPFVFIL